MYLTSLLQDGYLMPMALVDAPAINPSTSSFNISMAKVLSRRILNQRNAVNTKTEIPTDDKIEEREG